MTFEEWWAEEGSVRADEPELARDAWDAGRSNGVENALAVVRSVLGTEASVCGDILALLDSYEEGTEP